MNFTAGQLGQFIARFVDLVEGATCDQYTYAFLKKLPCRVETDTAATAGDDCALALDT